jgi:hypothetical protein
MSYHREHANKKTLDMYEAVPDYIKDDIGEAITWAKKTLTDHEGSGHQFYVHGSHKNPGLVVCSFAKPQWSGDHCSREMEHGAEAIVMAVCEYLNGM